MRQLQNYMEETVRRQLEALLPTMDICQCHDCRMDITALTLNRLPSHYVVTDKGVIYARLDELDLQHSADMNAAIAEAVEIVRRNPRHNAE